jgi:hypothetical protein
MATEFGRWEGAGFNEDIILSIITGSDYARKDSKLDLARLW